MPTPRRSGPWPKWARLCFVLSLLAAVPLPLTADWLLLRDGSQIETRGPWRIEDGLVTFKMAERGTLVSLRLGEIDLAQSAAVTRERAKAARRGAVAPPPPARRAPVLVLTDRDVRKVERPERPPLATPGAAIPSSPVGKPAGESDRVGRGLEVAKWRRSENPATGGVVIEGELRNLGEGLAIGLELTVDLTDAGGASLESTSAVLSATTLAPRKRARFRAEFPGPVEFSDVRFTTGLGAVAEASVRRVQIRWPDEVSSS